MQFFTSLKIALVISEQLRGEFGDLLVQEKIPKNTKPFQFLQKKKLQELVKMENKLQKPYLRD